MWRAALAMCLSYQYQRSRSSTASATKYMGMPLYRASSITDGSSNSTVADKSKPSSERSTRSCDISVGVLSARRAPGTTNASHTSKHSHARSSGLFQQRVIEAVVITFHIVPEGIVVFPGL